MGPGQSGRGGCCVTRLTCREGPRPEAGEGGSWDATQSLRPPAGVQAYFVLVRDVSRIRASVGWTLCWYAVAGLLSVPLAAVRMPSRGDPCDGLVTDPHWMAWLFRDVLWISLVVFLPVSAAAVAVLVWRSGLSGKTCAAIGVGVGFILVSANLCYSWIMATCYSEITHVG